MKGSNEPNPFLNALIYDDGLSGSEMKEQSANVIAENLCSQADEDVFNRQILDYIVYYRKDTNAVDNDDI